MQFPAHFFKSRPASGPGIHTDEASSALNSLVEEGLPEADARLLRMVSRGVITRSNPDEIVEHWRKPKAKKPPKKMPKGLIPVGQASELVTIAFLCTGQWGTERATLRRKLPMLGVRGNPDLERMNVTFFQRMELLRDQLIAQGAKYNARYEHNEAILKAAGLDLAALPENKAAELERVGKTDVDPEESDDGTPVPSKDMRRGWSNTLYDLFVAVEHILEQRDRSPSERTIESREGFLGLKTWGDLSKDGNQKLPFVAYSELPMATCPGAGACGVGVLGFDKEQRNVYREAREGEMVLSRDEATGALSKKPAKPGSKVPVIYKGKQKTEEVPAGQKGWCYSFTAWRYPDAFRRQALNTLANYADREFAILANGGPENPARYEERVEAAIRGERRRVWTHWIEQRALQFTKRDRAAGKKVFMRLFVDGDINTEDNIFAWMNVCKRLNGEVEVYGYSKCWQQFLNVNARFGRSFWPSNYVVNLSSGSVYVGDAEVRSQMESLPISRGYFEAINLHRGYIKELREQTDLLAKNPAAVIPMNTPAVPFAQFPFSEDRIKMLLKINAVTTMAQARALVPSLKKMEKEPTKPNEIRQRAFHAWLTDIVHNPEFGAFVRSELAKDNAKKKIEAAEYKSIENIEKENLIQMFARGETRLTNDFSLDKLTKKALSLVLQEVLWTYGLGGSCPLVCGNCSDDPSDATKGVHRCAAKPGSPFWHAKIHIGIH